MSKALSDSVKASFEFVILTGVVALELVYEVNKHLLELFFEFSPREGLELVVSAVGSSSMVYRQRSGFVLSF